MIDSGMVDFIRSVAKGMRVSIVGGPERYVGKTGEIVSCDVDHEYPLRVYIDGFWNEDAVRFRLDQVKPVYDGDSWLWDVLQNERKINDA